MNMLSVLTQDGESIYGCTSFHIDDSVINGEIYIRGCMEKGWVDLGSYRFKDDAHIIITRMFFAMENGGKAFRMPRKDEV